MVDIFIGYMSMMVQMKKLNFNVFNNQIDIIIDGGKTNEIPSTIVRVDNDKINILREGSLRINN